MIDPEAALDIFHNEQQRQARQRYKAEIDLHELDLRLRRLCRELTAETTGVIGVILPLNASRCLDAIRYTLAKIDDAWDEPLDEPF